MTRIEELIGDWIGSQRWFAGKGRTITGLTIEADIELLGGDPGLRHLVVIVRQGHTVDRYQLLLGLRSQLPDRLRHVEIGRVDGQTAYDAAHDADLMAYLLSWISSGHHVDPISFHGMADIRVDLRSLVLTAEQSNTSLVYGEAYILKLFRRLTPGINPDLEVVTALAELGSQNIAKPYGWFETILDGRPTTCAILQDFLPTATDGWHLALTSVRDLYASRAPAAEAGGDFAGEAFRLGTATADLHRELASAFGTDEFSADEVRLVAAAMHERLLHSAAEVPELGAHAEVASTAFDRLAKLDRAIAVQRVHGDYHLGQVLRTEDHWVVLDFEGEPGQPLASRRALSSPLRDVAGMLRSFDYAARHLAMGNPDASAERAAEWAERNRAAFCAGYGVDLRKDETILRAFELDKAVYEVAYEAHNRPAWLPIPLAAFDVA